MLGLSDERMLLLGVEDPSRVFYHVKVAADQARRSTSRKGLKKAATAKADGGTTAVVDAEVEEDGED